MRYQVLACDYDGTIAHHGVVSESTVAALERLLATGRRLVLVTGREVPDLLRVFDRLDLFEWVVAENGALLYHPASREERPLAPPPDEKFLQALRRRKVSPVSVGRVIVATWEPHDKTVFEAIHDLGLELQVIFNKGAVMVLPAGVNKASGLAAALKRMGLSCHNAAGVGDAENDHAFLRLCECAAAVANALPAVKEAVDLVTAGDHGAGVAELVDEMIRTDLSGRDNRLARHHLLIGSRQGGEVKLPPYGPGLLIVGPSASGKSTVATGFLEELGEQRYQYCVIDPEGDYESFEGCMLLGGPRRPPSVEEVLKALENPETNVVVSMTGMAIAHRPPFFLELLPLLLKMRARTGRPHWLVLDEAHHLLPAAWKPPEGLLPQALHSVVLITVHAELLSPDLLSRVDTLLVVGQEAVQTIHQFAAAVGAAPPATGDFALEQGEALLWRRGGGPPRKMQARASRTERRRHRRKYAEGSLPPERSFYFRGPAGKLNLRAQNLMLFLQVADGVDDRTWDFHLHRGDYSRWFREGIKDERLAAEAARIEHLPRVKPAESRAMIRAAIERDYTLPASPTLPVEGAS
jgi:hydroxymethylpyrimidine pyrophosphatase-like HAD family hydrolase